MANEIKNRKVPNDKFYTPLELVEDNINFVKQFVKPEDNIFFDPFYGDGAYFKKFESHFPNKTYDFTEIEMNKDFFQYTNKVDIIISNPPYSCINKVLEHSVSLKPRVISYLIGFHNLTPKRISYMNSNGYSLVFIHFTKISSWFANSMICIFLKQDEIKNCISFDNKIYRINK